jgi:hypothetical protein
MVRKVPVDTIMNKLETTDKQAFKILVVTSSKPDKLLDLME